MNVAMRNWLTTKDEVTKLLDDAESISTEKRVDGFEKGYIRVLLLSEFPTMMSGGASSYNQARLELHCESTSDIKARAIAKATKNALGNFGRGTMDTLFVNCITDISVSQNSATLIAGDDRFPSYIVTITLDFTEPLT